MKLLATAAPMATPTPAAPPPPADAETAAIVASMLAEFSAVKLTPLALSTTLLLI